MAALRALRALRALCRQYIRRSLLPPFWRAFSRKLAELFRFAAPKPSRLANPPPSPSPPPSISISPPSPSPSLLHLPILSSSQASKLCSASSRPAHSFIQSPDRPRATLILLLVLLRQSPLSSRRRRINLRIFFPRQLSPFTPFFFSPNRILFLSSVAIHPRSKLRIIVEQRL